MKRTYITLAAGMLLGALAHSATAALRTLTFGDAHVGQIQGYVDEDGQVGMEFEYVLPVQTSGRALIRIEPLTAEELAWEWHAAGGTF